MLGSSRWIGIAALCGALLLSSHVLAADSSGLERALDHLQSARAELERGGKDKGHRKDALVSVNEAIEHVRKAIQKEGKKKK
jgi:hypothetical protein